MFHLQIRRWLADRNLPAHRAACNQNRRWKRQLRHSRLVPCLNPKRKNAARRGAGPQSKTPYWAPDARRGFLGVRAFVRRRPNAGPVHWTPAKDKLLGKMGDGKAARRLGCTARQIRNRRLKLGIQSWLMA